MVDRCSSISLKPLLKSNLLLFAGKFAKVLNIRYISFIILFLLWNLTSSEAQTTIWLEDFQGLADGTTIDNGVTAWSRDVTNCDFTDGDNGYFEVRSNTLEGRDTDGEAIWYSQWIDISAYTDVKLSVDLSANGIAMGADDYVRAYYSLNGGPETLFFNGDQSGQFGNVTAFAGSFTSDSVQVIIRMNNSSFFFFFWWPAINGFDNVTVFEGPDTRFAIQAGGNWNDPTTWSYFSGGATCNCIPDVFSVVHINEATDGQSVALNVDSDAN